MRQTHQIGPRIDSQLKEVFDRHLERENKALGEEVEKAIKNWLANYYLINDNARSNVPDEDAEYIKRAIGHNSYEIGRAAEKLQESQGGGGIPSSIDFGESASETSSANDQEEPVESSLDDMDIQGLESAIPEDRIRESLIDKIEDADDEEIIELVKGTLI